MKRNKNVWTSCLFRPPNRIGSELFCRPVWNHWVVWTGLELLPTSGWLFICACAPRIFFVFLSYSYIFCNPFMPPLSSSSIYLSNTDKYVNILYTTTTILHGKQERVFSFLSFYNHTTSDRADFYLSCCPDNSTGDLIHPLVRSPLTPI